MTSSRAIRRRPPLGQHFLRDPRVLRTIIEAAELQPHDIALEIGPGKGVLTELLAPRVSQLVAIELDRKLASKLQARLADRPQVTIVQGDFLKSDLDDLFKSAQKSMEDGSEGFPPIKVLGNIPYSITAPIFEKLLSWPRWESGVFLIQREVGDRIRSGPGSRTYGVLSLAVQLFAEVEAIMTVKPGAFVPPPNVMSQVIRLRRRETPGVPSQAIPDFFDLVHAAFSHRRKTLANSLSLFAKLPKKNVEAWLHAQRIDANARAESLGLDQYAALAGPWAIFRR